MKQLINVLALIASSDNQRQRRKHQQDRCSLQNRDNSRRCISRDWHRRKELLRWSAHLCCLPGRSHTSNRQQSDNFSLFFMYYVIVIQQLLALVTR